MHESSGLFSDVLNIADMRLKAQKTLPRAIFDFIDGAAEDEVSRKRNRSQFDEVMFRPQVFRDVSQVDQSIELFGRQFSSPFGIGPTGMAGLAWPKAELHLARAAEKLNIPFTLSTVSSVKLESVAESVANPNWFQLYIFRDRDLSRDLLTRAKNAGYDVLVITADCPTGGNRERDPRNHFTLPLRVTPKNLFDVISHPVWAVRAALNGAPRPENMVEAAAAAEKNAQGLVAFMNSQLDSSVTWQDVKEFAAMWDGPVVIKGILNLEDAKRAARAGSQGIILSNHGGRQLDGAISPLMILPKIHDELGDDLTILCDSGFRRGSDVIKALALGADGILMGRNTLYGVAAGGEGGVAQVVSILQAEIERAMILLGVKSIGEIGREHIGQLRTSVEG